MRQALLVFLATFAFFSPPLAAQYQIVHPVDRAARPAPAADFDAGKAVAAGILGTIAGLGTGAVIGHRFDSRPCEFCVEVGLLGAFVGGSVGSPFAVHLSNGRRGRLGPAVLASLAIAVGGMGAAAAVHDGRVLLAVPILQIASAIAIERRTAARTAP